MESPCCPARTYLCTRGKGFSSLRMHRSNLAVAAPLWVAVWVTVPPQGCWWGLEGRQPWGRAELEENNLA